MKNIDNVLPYNPIQISHDTEIPKSSQSADTFFHFVDKFKYFKEIINEKQFPIRYSKEDFSDFNININEALIAMKCFCDIPLHNIKLHRKEYGYFCVGLTKNWGIKHGLQPVFYYNQKSNFPIMINNAFEEAMRHKNKDSIKEITEIINYILKYQKHVSGKDFKTGKIKDFTDEKEWRYVPNVANNLDFSEVVIEKSVINNNELKEFYNTELKENGYSLKFEYDDIKYLFVKTAPQRKTLIKLINKTSEDIDTKNKLISKICVWDEMEGDF